MRIVSPAHDFKAIWQAEVGERPIGHSHFWERALSRRQLLGRSAGLAGIALGSAFGLPAIAKAKVPGNGEPRPIPGGTILGPPGLFHFYFPTSPNPPSGRRVMSRVFTSRRTSLQATSPKSGRNVTASSSRRQARHRTSEEVLEPWRRAGVTCGLAAGPYRAVPRRG